MADAGQVPELRSKGRPSVEEAARIDREILSAARRVLAEQGEMASLNAVARAAGLSRKTVYARYGSREELFVAAARQALDDVRPIAFAPAETFEERLCNYIVATLDLVSSDSAISFQRVLVSNGQVMPDMRAALAEATRTMFFTPLLTLVEAGCAAGEIVADDPQAVAQIVFEAMMGHMMTKYDACASPLWDAADHARYARALAAMAARGLLPR